jgi:cholera toxin transcriptional activator
VFEANLETGELRKRGVRIKIQEQPLQILAMLLERRGQVVTRDERTRLFGALTPLSISSVD